MFSWCPHAVLPPISATALSESHGKTDLMLNLHVPQSILSPSSLCRSEPSSLFSLTATYIGSLSPSMASLLETLPPSSAVWTRKYVSAPTGMRVPYNGPVITACEYEIGSDETRALGTSTRCRMNQPETLALVPASEIEL